MMGMPTCREVMRETATGSLEEAKPWRRLGVQLHVMLCRHCRRYARQIQAIGMATRELLRQPSGEDESLERLRKSLLDRLDQPDAD